MPTICELQIEAKKKGLKGYSKLKKSALERFVKEGKSAPKKEPKKKETKKKEEPKRLTFKPPQAKKDENQEKIENLSKNSISKLKKMLDIAIKNKKAVSDLAAGKGSTDAEKKQASKKINTFDEKINNIREAIMSVEKKKKLEKKKK